MSGLVLMMELELFIFHFYTFDIFKQPKPRRNKGREETQRFNTLTLALLCGLRDFVVKDE